jgi:hypothetical protein
MVTFGARNAEESLPFEGDLSNNRDPNLIVEPEAEFDAAGYATIRCNPFAAGH